MIARAAIAARATEWGLTEEVVEKDYVLGWLLWGIGSEAALRDHWIFKGGTCLKKCFVETYRFSEDLDFTILPGGPMEPDALLPVLATMLDQVEQATGITLTSRPAVVRMRPDERSAEGRLYYRGPRGTPGEARIKLGMRSRPERAKCAHTASIESKAYACWIEPSPRATPWNYQLRCRSEPAGAGQDADRHRRSHAPRRQT